MTESTNKHAIALSDKEFALLETVYQLGPCDPERVLDTLKGSDLTDIERMLHDLTRRGFLIRPEFDKKLLYSVKSGYAEVRRRVIVLEDI
jgi:hypothetical protein